MISWSSISIPTKRQWLEDSGLRKFLCLGILINQRKPFGLSLPTTVGLTNPSPHSSVWRQKMLPSGVADFRRIDRKWRIASGEAVVTRRADHSPGDHP